MIVYISKTDIAEIPEKLKKAKYETNLEKLKDEILKMAKNFKIEDVQKDFPLP